MPDMVENVRKDRTYDLVLMGATGFTGGLTAAYLARHAPAGLRWALAGRNLASLERVRTELTEIDASLAELPLLTADSGDEAGLRAVAEQTRVIVSTVGPYLELGGPLVAACAASGTDYLDLTGEPEFMDRMYLEHHETALATGARIVHACGFDSVPHDLGALFTVGHFDGSAPITMRGVVRASGNLSGGTFHSAVGAMTRMKEAKQAYADRRAAERRRGELPEGRSSRAVTQKPHRDKLLGYWLLPLPTCDPVVVARSGAALEEYGPTFRYSHFAGTRTLRAAAGGVAGVAGIFGAAQITPLRERLLDKLQRGQGPSESRRQRGWFTVDLIAESAGRTVHTRVSGGDPGYGETSKMLAESALCLALDDVPARAGSLTPATAMGGLLIDRLQAAGIVFEEV